MSANMNWIACRSRIGAPNACALARELERVGHRALRQPDAARADDRSQRVERQHRVREPAPSSSPSSRSRGTRTLSKTMLAVGTPRTPILRSVRATEKPGLFVSTMKPEMPRAPSCGRSWRTRRRSRRPCRRRCTSSRRSAGSRRRRGRPGSRAPRRRSRRWARSGRRRPLSRPSPPGPATPASGARCRRA